MAEFRPAGSTRVNAFRVGGDYLFKEYLEEELFAELRRYYDEYEYRFEVPAGRFEHVRELLAEHGYALREADPEAFAVVKRTYTDHPDVLFEESVFHRGLGKFNCFVMADRDAVEAAVAAGARRLAETDLEL